MKKLPLISVIIPVYNAELLLKKCIESICEQTFSNLQIIIINDGSSDKSSEIVRKIAEHDFRIELIEQENQGAAQAKNVGLQFVKGEYLMFVDSDDFIHNNMIERLYNLSVIYDSDLVQCSYEIGNSDSFSMRENKITISTYSNRNVFESKLYKSVVWGKLYKKEIFNKVFFTKGRHIDDESVSYKTYYKSKKIIITNEKLYYYYQSKESLMRNNKKVNTDFVTTFQERLLYFLDKKEMRLYRITLEKFAISLMLYYISISRNTKNTKSDLDFVFNRFRLVYEEIKKERIGKIKFLLMLFIFRHFPNAVVFSVKLFRLR